jgi:peptidoglycan hydrolase-like protein with peptidoglycan-binding domain
MTPPGAPEMTLTEGYFSSKTVTTAPLMTAGNYNVVLYCWDASGAAANQTMTFNVKSAALQIKLNQMVLGASTSNTSCVDIPRNLIRGSESSYVTTLQNFLFNTGFLNETSTGFYGDKTVEAVKDYQASKGLPVTGMVYDFTRQAIVADTCQ